MYIVKVENLSQLDVVLAHKDVSEIILARDSFAENDLPKLVSRIKSKNKKVWIMLERISRYEEIKALRTSTDRIYDLENLDGIIIQNLDSFSYMQRKINFAKNENLQVELNYTMNCYNIETKKLYEKLYSEKRKNADSVPLRFTAPVELNAYELNDVGYDTMVVYSYIDTMVSANCLRKNLALQSSSETLCKNRFNFDKVEEYAAFIKDRKNKDLHYKTYCKYCYNKIFNVEPLYLIDMLGSQSSHAQKLRIDFSFESAKVVSEILANKIPTSFTRGHYKNSIN